MIKSKLLGADWVLGLGYLVEQPRTLVHSILADVNVFLNGANGSSLTEGRVV